MVVHRRTHPLAGQVEQLLAQNEGVGLLSQPHAIAGEFLELCG
jgi:hypothetical protein